jgi:hypothetical protein
MDTNYINDELIEFNLNQSFKDTIIIDIKAYKDKFYILTRDGLYKYFDLQIEKIKNINDAQVITIDLKLKILFVVSYSRGLIGINLKNDYFVSDIPLDIFNDEKKQVPVTSITAYKGVIFLSILNYGVFRIDYNKKSSKFVYQQIQKMKLQNPQELYFNHKDNELAIVDFDHGLILINLKDGETFKQNLPNDDIPNSIRYINYFGRKCYIIQCRNSLYKFDKKSKEFTVIDEKKVSNLITYYNKIYYTHNGVLNIKNV